MRFLKNILLKQIKKNKYLFVIGGCLLMAGFFIFDHITDRCFWIDEALMANALSAPFFQIYRAGLVGGGEYYPLFYIYTLKFWSLIFGDSELAIRCFSAFFGLVLIIFIYQAGRYIFRSKKVGFWAAFLASTNYFLIWFSTQGRQYTLAALLGLLSYYFFFKLIRLPKKLIYIFYVFFTLAGIYTHPWLSLIFASQLLALFCFRKDILNYLKIFLNQIIIILFSIPNALMVFHLGKIGATSWMNQVGISAFFESFKNLSFGSSWLYLIFSVIALIFLLEQKAKLKEKRVDIKQRKFINFNLGLYLLFPLVSALIISQFRPVYVVGRYEMVVLPAFILILANLFSKIKIRYILLLMISLLIIFAFKSVVNDRNYVYGLESNDKITADFLLGEIKNGDTIIATDLNWSIFYYYFSHLDKDKDKKFDLISFPQEIMNEHPGWQNLNKMIKEKSRYEKEAEELALKLKEQKEEKTEIWVLYYSLNPINEILYKELEQNFSLVNVQKLPELRQPSWFDMILVFK